MSTKKTNKKEPIHYLKSRKSDYMAGVDLEIWDLEGKSKKLTISNVEFVKSTDKKPFRVNGRIKDKALIIYFKEDYAKPLICNTTNSRKIKELTGVIDATNWVGFSIEFYFNTDVVMKRQQVGGIRISDVFTNGLTADLKDIDTRIKEASNRAELMNVWNELTEALQIQYREDFTNKNKTF